MDEWKQSLDKLSEKSLLVSTPKRILVRFFCPITAKVKKPIAGYKQGDTVFVEGIKQDRDHQLLYLIDSLYLPHTYFEIQS
jgi:hypothetical protein